MDKAAPKTDAAAPVVVPGFWQRVKSFVSTGRDTAPMNPAWLGNRIGMGSGAVLLSVNEQRQPRRVLGGDGSGRVSVLSAMAKAAIDSGQGLIYVDTQDDVNVALTLLGCAAQAGRAHEVRILRWMKDAPMGLPFDHSFPPGVRYSGVIGAASNTFNPIERDSVEVLKTWLIPTLQPEEDELGGLPWGMTRVFLEYWLAILFNDPELPKDLAAIHAALTSDKLSALGQRLAPTQGGNAQAVLAWWRAAFNADHLAATPASDVWLSALRHRWKGLMDTPLWERPHDEVHDYAAELSWPEAIERRQIVLVQLPLLNKSVPSTVRAAEGLLRHLAASAAAHLTTWDQNRPPRALWVFDHASRYLSAALAQLTTLAPTWGIATAWGDEALRVDDHDRVDDPLSDICPLHVFLRNGASTAYMQERFGAVPEGRDLAAMRPGEGWVALYDRWMCMRMAYQEPNTLTRGVVHHPIPAWRRPFRSV